MSCIKSITKFPPPSTRKKGRPPKTWSECVKTDVNKCGLAVIDPLDRDAGRAVVGHSLVLPGPLCMGHGLHLHLKWIWMDGCHVTIENSFLHNIIYYPKCERSAFQFHH